MATFAADILSAFSGPPGDGGIRNVRETALNSTGSRKGFSSVLRSVRGEVGRATIREADDTPPVNNAGSASSAEGTKESNNSPHLSKSDASAQTMERASTSKSDEKLADETQTGSESLAPQTDVGSGLQDQGPLPLSGLIFVSSQPQVVDQAQVQTKSEPDMLGDETNVDTSTAHSLMPSEPSESWATTPKPDGRSSSLKGVGVRSDLSSTQPSPQAKPPMNDGEVKVPGVEQGATDIIKESRKIAADLSGSTPVHKDVLPAASLGSHNPGSPQVVQAHVQSTSLQGNVLVPKLDPAKPDGALADHPDSSQGDRLVQAGRDHYALGTSTEQSFSHGQQFGSDGSEQFAELSSGPHGQQMGADEPKISHPFVVDPTIGNGSVVDSTVQGSSRQAITSPPGTPAPTSFGTQVPPSSRVEDTAQSAGMPVMRSVVLNVTQPDIGHVNIRVAMTNDVVHTHFSSDRLEVGQFIVNGQDRLQAALQSSGLDMGQFRVDIDRQSGGRSFQQGASQDHGQSWSQGSHGMGQESHPDQQGPMRGTRHGLLNVVA